MCGKEWQSDARLYLHADLQCLESLWGQVNHEDPASADKLKHLSKSNKTSDNIIKEKYKCSSNLMVLLVS